MNTPDSSAKRSKMTVLLSVNAAAILVAGILIASAIWFNGGMTFRAVDERSDIVSDDMSETGLIDSVTDSNNTSSVAVNTIGNDDYISTSSHEFDNSPVPAGELWNESSIVIYATPDIDLCVGGGLSELGEMYWQTSDASVISGFFNSARTWLGYDDQVCRYPVIKGYGTSRTMGT